MFKIGSLLFPEIRNFDPEQISKYPISVRDLIEEESRKEIQKTEALFSNFVGDETQKSCKPFRESNKSKKQRLEESQQILKDWHGFKKRDLTEEDELDLQALQLRKYIDPKGSGKGAQEINKNYMQLGTILDDPLAGKSGRIKKKDRKGRVIEQLAAEDSAVNYTKKKFLEIQNAKMKQSRNKKWMKMKKAKGNKREFKHEAREIDFN